MPTGIRRSLPPTILRTTRPEPRPGADRPDRPEPSSGDEPQDASRNLETSRQVAVLSAKVKLFDENSPGEMVVTPVPVMGEVWPRAPDAHGLAILPRAPQALLAPVAQVLPRVRASKRHASATRSTFNTRRTVARRLVRAHGRRDKAPIPVVQGCQQTEARDFTLPHGALSAGADAAGRSEVGTRCRPFSQSALNVSKGGRRASRLSFWLPARLYPPDRSLAPRQPTEPRALTVHSSCPGVVAPGVRPAIGADRVPSLDALWTMASRRAVLAVGLPVTAVVIMGRGCVWCSRWVLPKTCPRVRGRVRSSCGKPRSMALAFSSVARWFSVRVTSRAPRLSWSWDNVRAPMIGAVTTGLRSVQASAGPGQAGGRVRPRRRGRSQRWPVRVD